MKILITKEQLVGGLRAVQNIASSRTTLPILSNVLLQTGEGNLTLTSTDLDVTISAKVDATVKDAGDITLPARLLNEIVGKVESPDLELEVKENICSIEAGASFFRLHGLPVDEFPPVPEEKGEAITLNQGKLRFMLRYTSYAVSKEETRYVLNGILFSFGEGKLALVATDGRRLALMEEAIEAPEGRCIVPTKAITELGKLLGDLGKVTLRHTENQASFALFKDGEEESSVNLTTKLIDGTYPNYQQVIPKDSKETATLEREEFLAALRRAEIMTSDKSSSVKLELGENKLLITANTPEVGEVKESIAVSHEGGEMAIAFNPLYLIDSLRELEEDEVFLELTDELSPGVLRTSGPFKYVVMPMRMN